MALYCASRPVEFQYWTKVWVSIDVGLSRSVMAVRKALKIGPVVLLAAKVHEPVGKIRV